MPSVGLIPLLCSCLVTSPSACATVPFAVSYTQPLLGHSQYLLSEQLIAPTYYAAVSGQVIILPSSAPAQVRAQAPAAVASSAPAPSAVAFNPAPPAACTQTDTSTAFGATPGLDDQPAAADSAVAPSEPSYEQAVTFLPQTVFIRPLIRYTNIPVTLLDATNPVDRVAALVSSNEGTPTTIDWNDNGHGVSVGIFQANQRVGELPQLLHQLAVIPSGEQAITSAFGEHAATQIKNNPEAVRKWRFSPKNTLGRGLQKLVHNGLFQKLQVAVLRRKVTMAAQVAADYGITSTAGVAVCADLTNQWGRAGARRFLKAADSMHSQGGKISAIVSAVSKGSAYGSRYQSDLEKVQADGLSVSEPFVVQTANEDAPMGASRSR